MPRAYNLSGVGGGQVISECPSCGTTFDPGDGARPRRWPATWKAGVVACGGMMVLGALYLLAWIAAAGGDRGWSGARGAGGSSFSKELVVILDQCVLAVWFVVPVCVAMYLSHRYAYRGERWTVGLGLAVGDCREHGATSSVRCWRWCWRGGEGTGEAGGREKVRASCSGG